MQTTTHNGNLPFIISPDIRQRADDLKKRLTEGEAMTTQQLADAVGLPWEFAIAAIAIMFVLKNGVPVTIEPAPAPRPN